MSELVNLNRARKQRARAAGQAKAAENRVRFGRSKAERAAADAESSLQARTVEAHRREPDGGGE